MTKDGLRFGHNGEAPCKSVEEVFGGAPRVVREFVSKERMMRLDTETALDGEGLNGLGDASVFGIFGILLAFDQRELDALAHGFVDEMRVEEILLACGFDGDLDGPEDGMNMEDCLGDFCRRGAGGPGMENEDEGGRAMASDNEGGTSAWTFGFCAA